MTAGALLAVVPFSTSAFAADPPPSDDDVEVSAEPAKGPPPAKPAATPAKPPAQAAAPSRDADIEALRAELSALRKEVDAQREAKAEAKPDAAAHPPDPRLGIPLGWGLYLTGYLQTQYESHQDSEDQLRQGGVPYNQDRFVVRRARIRVNGEWEYAAASLELDGNTTRGLAFGLRNAWAALQYRPDKTKLPIVMATVGLFDTPFGYELTESPRFRPFMERSQASRAYFPGEPDIGAKVSGALGFFRWSIAAMNGEPLDERNGFAAQDPNSAKDVMFRFGVDTNAPSKPFGIAGGISGLRGKGFKAGLDQTKPGVDGNDKNGNGQIDPYEISTVGGSAGEPSQSFDRWAVGADLQFKLRTSLGTTKVYGELTLAQNLDRGLFVSDPIQSQHDLRSLGWYAAVLQDVTRYGLAGFRVDYYDPDADLFEHRAAKDVPKGQAITTFSPMAGFVLPDRAKLLFQYDIIKDKLARDVTGVPVDMKNNTWTLRLQVDL